MGYPSATELSKLIGLTKPVSFGIDGKPRILSLPGETVIFTDIENYRERMPLLIAKAYLSEIDPLLVSPVCEVLNASEKKKKDLVERFTELCCILENVWAYKVLQLKAPDIYERASSKLFGEVYKLINTASGTIYDPAKIITIFTSVVVSHFPPKIKDLGFLFDKVAVGPNPKLVSEKRITAEVMISLSAQNPDIMHYANLPALTAEPYGVKILSNKGRRLFVINGFPKQS